eukprot:TRINITY_DN11036_c0_g1_i1.p1 TRINITY_DN11036_c0_g1~~TRINITY_DN11036_c0_g1_i1.p1  ORF type:complete len:274 (+),score=69.15 TRINITY_DN11036_c0_g1_i1:47-868(+)
MQESGRNLLCLFFGLLFLSVVESRTSSYYEIINVISEGKDLFAILDVTPQSTPSEIRKSFRKLSIQLHPDKGPENRTPDGEQKYRDLTFAYEVLRDDEMRAEYEQLKKSGISRVDAFYGRYAYRYGAPNTRVEYILFGLVVAISCFQYFYKYHRHVTVTRYAMATQRYKTRVAQAQYEGKEGPELVIAGAEKPVWTDLFIIKVILSPYLIPKFFYDLVTRKPKTPQELEEEARLDAGMDEDQWEAHKARMEQKMEQHRTSGRAKQYRRWLKKQ